MRAIPFKDRIIPWYFVLFFLVVVGVNSVMVTLAMRTSTGMVTDHPYEKGLAYNQVLSAVEKQNKLGWNGDISFQPTSRLEGVIQFALKDSQNKILNPENVILSITRPVTTGLDFERQMSVQSSSIFTAKVIFPEPGLWEVRIIARYKGTVVQYAKRMVVQ